MLLKEFVSMFNKETEKRHFLTFSGNGYKKEKKNASSITRKKVATSKN